MTDKDRAALLSDARNILQAQENGLNLTREQVTYVRRCVEKVLDDMVIEI